jgi:hypothetical protein
MTTKLNRNYHDAYSIMLLNNRGRKQNYYNKNYKKIINKFIIDNVIQKKRWWSKGDLIIVKICWNVDERYLYHIEFPEVELKFEFNKFNDINLFVSYGLYPECRKKMNYLHLKSFASIINILKHYLKDIVKKYSDINDDNWELQNTSDVVIENDIAERIDYFELYNLNEDEIIRSIFIAIDSYYLGIHVEHHPCVFNYNSI